MINWIKRDFWRVREALGYLVNREIPMGIAILYYAIVGLIMLPISILLWIVYKIYLKYIIWDLKRESY